MKNKLISDETYARIGHMTWNELAHEYEKLAEGNNALRELANDVLTEWNSWGLRGDSPNPFTIALAELAVSLLTEKETP